MSNPVQGNQLLAALSQSEYQRLIPYLHPVSLMAGQVLYEPGETITEVYFPIQALISLISIQQDQLKAEIGLVGRQGMVGIATVLGGSSTMDLVMVQLAGSALKLDASILKTEFKRGGELQKVLLLYTQALLTQMVQNGVCQAHYSVKARLACWLLLAQSYSQQEELLWTQEFISNLLNTRRASITEAVNSLSKAGTIRSQRGKITILDRQALGTFACAPCVQIQQEDDRLQKLASSPPELFGRNFERN